MNFEFLTSAFEQFVDPLEHDRVFVILEESEATGPKADRAPGPAAFLWKRQAELDRIGYSEEE